MGQISVEIPAQNGSVLSGNQHSQLKFAEAMIMERETAWNAKQHQIQIVADRKCRLSILLVSRHRDYNANGRVDRLDSVAFYRSIPSKRINRILNDLVHCIRDERAARCLDSDPSHTQAFNYTCLNGRDELGVSSFQCFCPVDGCVELAEVVDAVHLHAPSCCREWSIPPFGELMPVKRSVWPH